MNQQISFCFYPAIKSYLMDFFLAWGKYVDSDRWSPIGILFDTDLIACWFFTLFGDDSLMTYHTLVMTEKWQTM